MPKPLTLLNRFDRLNRKHFRGKLKRPSMVRFSKKPSRDSATVVGYTYVKGTSRYILIHEILRPFDGLIDLVLIHEMVHYWNWERGISSGKDDCLKMGSSHHRKMLSILAKEPVLC